jgi:hypothetical protein
MPTWSGPPQGADRCAAMAAPKTIAGGKGLLARAEQHRPVAAGRRRRYARHPEHRHLPVCCTSPLLLCLPMPASGAGAATASANHLPGISVICDLNKLFLYGTILLSPIQYGRGPVRFRTNRGGSQDMLPPAPKPDPGTVAVRAGAAQRATVMRAATAIGFTHHPGGRGPSRPTAAASLPATGAGPRPRRRRPRTLGNIHHHQLRCRPAPPGQGDFIPHSIGGKS